MKMILNKVLEILGAVLLVGMVAVVLWQVFSRTVLGNPNTVTEELVRSCLVCHVVFRVCCGTKSTFSRNGFK